MFKRFILALLNFCIFCYAKICVSKESFLFSITPESDGFYKLSGKQAYIDDFSGIHKECIVNERSGANFFNNCNDDCCWYVSIGAANVKMGHNARMIDVQCKEVDTGTATGYNCYGEVTCKD